MTWIKICGTTTLHDAQVSIAAGADALGFIFAPSPRRVEMTTAAEIVAQVPSSCMTIGVFVNEDPKLVAAIAEQVGLSGVQLHGTEEISQLLELRRLLGSRTIVKGFSLSGDPTSAIDEFLHKPRSYDAILLDSGSSQQRGGTGHTFDWDHTRSLAAKIRSTTRLIVAGGLHSGNVGQALDCFDPWGVDVVSGVERGPGIKDESRLRAFVAAVRERSSARPTEQPQEKW